MFDDLQLHATTRWQLTNLTDKPSHGHLFIGTAGSGRRTIAERLAREWAKGDAGLVHILEPADSSIGIEAVSEIKPLLNQTVPSGRYRTLIIDQAHLLTREAQNNLLKLLEEPPSALRIILVTERADGVLPTIQSRLQTANFHPVGKLELIDWLQKLKPGLGQVEIERLYHLGNRTPGGMLSVSEQQNPSLELAKQFLQAKPYERSRLASGLQKAEKQEVDALLQNLTRLLDALLQQAVRTADREQAAELARKLGVLLQIRRDIKAHVNTRLLLSQLVVEL